MYIYAHINKETLKLIREGKGVSYEYISRMTKYSKEKLDVWEDCSTEKFPTINQAKTIAKCYRVPFAGLYMNPSDVKLKSSPKLKNLRTIQESDADDSALNLAIVDVLNSKDLLIETKQNLKEPIAEFNLKIETDEVEVFAEKIRKMFELNIYEQFRCPSARKFFLYLRDKVEKKGVFVHSFTGVSTDVVRGFAVYDEHMPVIGVNDEDRYPAKTFTIIHELVHIFKRNSAICNEMFNSFSNQSEEVFCNAVAGEVLAPRAELIGQLKLLMTDEVTIEIISDLADKFSVSREVISRRLFDIGIITKQKYIKYCEIMKAEFDREKENAREIRKLTGSKIPRNISREAIDQTSSALCKAFYTGYREGYFDKQDISRYLGIKQMHIDKFLWEVSKWKH